MASAAQIPEWRGRDAAAFRNEVLGSSRPMVLKGLIADWPAVRLAAAPDQVAAHIGGFYRGAPVEVFVGQPDIAGWFAYSADLAGLNFNKQQASLTDVIDYVIAESDNPQAPAIYIGAAAVPEHLPGFDARNPMPLLAGTHAVARIWIGNRITVSAHFDTSDNVACVVAGRRRFTIFPPEQVRNLYIGPLDHTLAGQPSSLVSANEPDFERFPLFREALNAAMVAELEPGDAIYIPTLWWHQVESLTPFNVLVNYWWDDAPQDGASPFEAMAHGILAISQLPEARRAAWRTLFDHYVFQQNGDPAAHLPVERRGILSPTTPQIRDRMKQFLVRALSQRRP